MLPLGEVLMERAERVGSPDADNLPLLGVSNTGGLHRSGKTRIPDMSRYLLVKRDWFAYNPMRINVGSLGWANSDELTGIISPDYVVFSATEKILPRLVSLFLKSQPGLRAINWQAAGSVRKRLYFWMLAEIKIPLPPLPEQHRIVARIETLAAKIDEARAVRRNVVEDCTALCRSILFNDPASPAIPTPLSELVSLRDPDVSVLADGIYHFAGVYCFGKGVFAGERKTGLDFAYKSLTRLRAGDFVYPKLMAWEGALGIVPPECDGLCVSPEYPVFAVNTERVLPEVLDVCFRSPSAWPQLAEISTGTNMRRRRLHPSSFLAFKMPLPPMETQMRLREVKTRLDSLADVQSQSAADLDALLPSILDKAFKGKL